MQIQDATLWLTSLVVVLALGSIVLGQFSTMTGKDHLPKRIRRRLRRVPATQEDHRMRGMSLTLNGAAMMMVALAITATPRIGMFSSGRFSRDAVFFITSVGLFAALWCSVASYNLYQRVQFVSTRASTDPHPEPPQA
jgi:hypothetical protein